MKLPMRLVKAIKKQAGPQATSVVMTESIMADTVDELLDRLQVRKGSSPGPLANDIGIARGVLMSWTWNL